MAGLSSTGLVVDAMRVVVVEDSTADAELLVAMLEVELPGAAVAVAATLEDGLRRVTPEIDAVITDLSLPDAEGLKALHAIRAAAPDTAVIVLTGRSDSELGMAAMLAGADDYVVKGALDSRALATAVQYAVQRRVVARGNRRFERLALSLLDAMESPTCAVGSNGEIIAVNAAWSSFSAFRTSRADIGANYFAKLAASAAVDVATVSAVAAGLQSVLDGGSTRFQFDFPCAADDGTQWFSARINPLPEAQGAVLTHVDVTVAKSAEQALAHQTQHDGLTDLPNRSLLVSRLSVAMLAASRAGLSVGVGFVDLDQFKRVNDSLGHQAGDELLVAVTDRLRGRLRGQDTLARFAGDEFVVVWPDLGGAVDAEELAERLRAAFDEPFQLGQASVSVTASIGVALGAAPQAPDELLLAADAAMYDAKSRGRGRTRMFSAELRDGAESRLRMEAEMRDALDQNQFVLHYQPVVDLRRGTVHGVEALVRWAHPDGLRMPDSFIPVAEASGMIVPLGTWVLQEACRQAAAWQRDGLSLDLAVNLSVRQVSHPDVFDAIGDALASSGLEPHRLVLEVTESVMLEDAEAAQVALARIADLGATIAIDDFGTGYSSLLYLKRYPVRALKVDRSFVSGMCTNKDDHAIVTSVVSLARAVGSACIAEGVETEEQHAALRAMGCDFAQGYLFGRPVSADELPATVAACGELLQTSPRNRPTRTTSGGPAIEQVVLDRIEQLHQAGASLHTIAAALNSERAPHPAAIRWHGVTVAEVIAGSYRPSNRRRAAPTTRVRRQTDPTPTPTHRTLMYSEVAELVAEVSTALSAGLDASEAVIVIAPADDRRRIEAALSGRGHDLLALSLTSQYYGWDAGDLLRELTVDGYISGRLFRQSVARRVEASLHDFGRVRIYGGAAGLLWERGEVPAALALEGLWHALSQRLSFDLVCGYRLAAVSAIGTEEDRLALGHTHPGAA